MAPQICTSAALSSACSAFEREGSNGHSRSPMVLEVRMDDSQVEYCLADIIFRRDYLYILSGCSSSAATVFFCVCVSHHIEVITTMISPSKVRDRFLTHIFM